MPRVREPNLPRRFTTPWVWFVAPAGPLPAPALMAALPWPTWQRLLIWFAIGIVIYFCYGVRRSNLHSRPPPTPNLPRAVEGLDDPARSLECTARERKSEKRLLSRRELSSNCFRQSRPRGWSRQNRVLLRLVCATNHRLPDPRMRAELHRSPATRDSWHEEFPTLPR